MKLFEIQERSVLSVYGQLPSHIDDYFDCTGNNLTSLVGSPQSVGGSFFCQVNKLISLAGAPQTVDGGFQCHSNQVKSFHNVHKIIKQINGDFYCDKGTHMLGIVLIKGVEQVVVFDDEKLTQIFKRYRHDLHLLQDALIDAGYREQAQL